MREEIKGKIKNIHQEEFMVQCIKCGRRHNLMMVAHRGGDHGMNIVGWVFTCTECFGEIINREIIIT